MADKDTAIAEDAVNKLNLRLTKLISSHRRDRNQDVAINRLPAEVLARIFFHSFDGSYASQFSRLHRLAKVSIRWSQLVKRTPELFGCVTTDNTTEHVHRMLRLSKNAPLDILYRKDPFSTSRRAELLETLLSQAHRWRSIEMSGVPPGVVNAVFQRTIPMLRDIHIVSNGYSEQICLDSETLGRLRYLTLERATLRWDPGNLKGLKSLDLSRIGTDGRPSQLQLLEILQASPGIQVLRLGPESVGDAPPSLGDYTPTELPQLSEISFTDFTSSTAYNLLKSVRIPNCKIFVVKCPKALETVSATAALFDSATNHVGPVVRSILQSISPISISLGPVMLLVCGRRKGYGLEVNIPMISLPDPIVWFESMIDSVPNSATISTPIDGTPESREPFPIFRHPSIDRVDIMGSSIGADRWIRHLGSPRLTDGILEWPLPRLTQLAFGNCAINPNQLIKMVRYRYGKEEDQIFGRKMFGEAEECEDRRSRPDKSPARLERLTISGCNHLEINDFKQLEGVIAAGNLICNNRHL
ncbi:hypothetical protein FRB94_007371 [Tulasnella sp. JGI-2019a]|nr:hypothetical protein FRB94_007371 [Tulasnella sp. JGI-2019a]KAG9014470.1 hypothetical protein FRB93_013595 [Tulasnella sp. JGI-2019a]KAG9039726.1 hypothetical protein FRB95_007153 [Tulasnella sp. JGI-2019a]